MEHWKVRIESPVSAFNIRYDARIAMIVMDILSSGYRNNRVRYFD
jgi:hypothetical protein